MESGRLVGVAPCSQPSTPACFEPICSLGNYLIMFFLSPCLYSGHNVAASGLQTSQASPPSAGNSGENHENVFMSTGTEKYSLGFLLSSAFVSGISE